MLPWNTQYGSRRGNRRQPVTMKGEGKLPLVLTISAIVGCIHTKESVYFYSRGGISLSYATFAAKRAGPERYLSGELERHARGLQADVFPAKGLDPIQVPKRYLKSISGTDLGDWQSPLNEVNLLFNLRTPHWPMKSERPHHVV